MKVSVFWGPGGAAVNAEELPSHHQREKSRQRQRRKRKKWWEVEGWLDGISILKKKKKWRFKMDERPHLLAQGKFSWRFRFESVFRIQETPNALMSSQFTWKTKWENEVICVEVILNLNDNFYCQDMMSAVNRWSESVNQKSVCSVFCRTEQNRTAVP